MKEAVLISIKPKWCELIANGSKTIEVRKTKPKLATPFKCYIYCTQARNPIRDSGRILMYEDDLALTNRWGQGKLVANPCGSMMEGEFFLNGRVIGEFVCDRVDTYDDDTIHAFSQEDYTRWNDYDLYRSCIHPEDFERYAADKWLYGWHISALVIYDEPRELGEFAHPCNRNCFVPCPYYQGKEYECEKPIITRPPQSWCYIEGALLKEMVEEKE